MATLPIVDDRWFVRPRDVIAYEGPTRELSLEVIGSDTAIIDVEGLYVLAGRRK